MDIVHVLVSGSKLGKVTAILDWMLFDPQTEGSLFTKSMLALYSNGTQQEMLSLCLCSRETWAEKLNYKKEISKGLNIS